VTNLEERLHNLANHLEDELRWIPTEADHNLSHDNPTGTALRTTHWGGVTDRGPMRFRPVTITAAVLAVAACIGVGVSLSRRIDQSTPPSATPSVAAPAPSLWDGGVALIVYMRHGAPAAEIEAVRGALVDPVDVSKLEYLDTQATLAEARRVLATDPNSLAFLAPDNVPTMFKVVPAPGATPEQIAHLGQTVRPLPGVLSVQTQTLVHLTETSPVLAPTGTLFDLTGFENGALAVSPDGRLIAGKVNGEVQQLYELRQDSRPLDLGIELQLDAAIAFGPRGDLFTVEHSLDGTSKVSEYRPTPTSVWTWVASADAGVTGACGITVTPAAAGCPGTGPALEFNPPVEYDRVEIDPSLTTVSRISGDVTRRWSIALDLVFDINCEDHTCAQMSAPGPHDSAIWFPYIYGQQRAQAVFVFDDRTLAGAAWLDPRINSVIGVHGSDLIAVQTVDGRLEVVTVDLSTILA
jgi:hypothetical protein